MATGKPGTPFPIHIDRGDTTRKCWDGEFRGKEILAFGDQIRIDRIKRDLLGPGPYDGADPEVVAQATVLAEIQVTLTDAPEWWQGGLAHSDTNLLMAIYQAALKIRNDHQAEVKKAGEEAQAKLRELTNTKP